MDRTLLLFQVVLYGNPQISGIARQPNLLGGGCVDYSMPERLSSPSFAWCVSVYAVRSIYHLRRFVNWSELSHTTIKVSINDKSAKTFNR
jgi:hypothetical protein